MSELSAVILNYNSGAYARSCSDSLRAECAREGIELELIIVDNNSPLIARDRPILEALASEGAKVIYHGSNPGYSGGMNLGLEHASAPVLAILNPDLHFFEGSVGHLFRYVSEHSECGVAGPKAYLDSGREVALPPNPLPGLRDHWAQVVAHLGAARARSYARRRSHLAHQYWSAREPMAVDMLSGCCVFLRREVLERIGGLFDERFPLYYEDADLFRRVSRAGLCNVFLPAAEIAHFYSRSTGTAHDEPMRRYWIAQQRYFAKWYGPLGYHLGYRGVHRLLDLWPSRWKKRPPALPEDLGACEDSPEFAVPGTGPFFLELTMDPMFFLAGGILDPPNPFKFGAASWASIQDNTYFLRAVDAHSFHTRKVWSFEHARAPVMASATPAGS